MSKVKLTISSDGHFELLDRSLPFGGQVVDRDGGTYLDVQTALGRSVRSPDRSFQVPVYRIVRLSDDEIRLDGEIPAQLHRVVAR